MKKKILTLVLCSIITISSIVFPSSAGSGYTLQTWTLIDSGGHLDWDGSSKYMTEWYDAVNTWNYYKHGVIRVDRWNIIEDVHICDKTINKNNSRINAEVSSGGKIVFYTEKMDKMTQTQRQQVIEHEIGHALGIGHSSWAYAIMYAYGPLDWTDLHDLDKKAYDAAWKKFVE